MPEPVVSAQLSEDIANELAVNHKVTVISPKPTRPFGFKFLRKDINKSYSLINLDSYTCPESNFYGRFKESYSLLCKDLKSARMQKTRTKHNKTNKQIDI